MVEKTGNSPDFFIPQETPELQERFRKELDENIKYNLDLAKRAREKEDLISAVECLVQRVEGTVYTNRKMTPGNEMRFGGSSPSYAVGDKSYLELEVESESAVRKITFGGLPPIEKGDKIRAYIYNGKEESEKEVELLVTLLSKKNPTIEDEIRASVEKYDIRSKPRTYWVRRDFNEKEEAVMIEKIKNNEVVATYINK